jgi:thiol:disulfide interchange protein DsbD
MRVSSIVFAVVIGLGASSSSGAQTQRPRAQLTPVRSPVDVRAGGVATVAVKVQLPPDIHVQANKPKDPSLIPTVLTVDAPPGVRVDEVSYPAPTEFAQVGREEKLAVLGPEFTIDVRLSIPATTAAGTVKVPARLRYQACNDKVCFPPTTGLTEWTLEVRSQ